MVSDVGVSCGVKSRRYGMGPPTLRNVNTDRSGIAELARAHVHVAVPRVNLACAFDGGATTRAGGRHLMRCFGRRAQALR